MVPPYGLYSHRQLCDPQTNTDCDPEDNPPLNNSLLNNNPTPTESNPNNQSAHN